MSQSEPLSDPPDPANPDGSAGEAASDQSAQRQPQRHSLLRGIVRQVQQAGRDVLSVAAGKWLEEPEEPEPTAAVSEADAEEQRLATRVRVMHNMAEKLRGAADNYIAAKLDEIEARVDAKLDHIERRIDEKIVALHEQLTDLRDRELRHRLRLLKITLIFTVLVALLSLGYKWLSERI